MPTRKLDGMKIVHPLGVLPSAANAALHCGSRSTPWMRYSTALINRPAVNPPNINLRMSGFAGPIVDHHFSPIFRRYRNYTQRSNFRETTSVGACWWEGITAFGITRVDWLLASRLYFRRSQGPRYLYGRFAGCCRTLRSGLSEP